MKLKNDNKGENKLLLGEISAYLAGYWNIRKKRWKEGTDSVYKEFLESD